MTISIKDVEIITTLTDDVTTTTMILVADVAITLTLGADRDLMFLGLEDARDNLDEVMEIMAWVSFL